MTHWYNGTRISHNNVAILEVVYSLLRGPSFSETLGNQGLLASEGQSTPSFNWRKLAHAGYERVRDEFRRAGGGELSVLEFWWLFHLFCDKDWMDALSEARIEGKGYDHPVLSRVFNVKASVVRWSLGDDPSLDVGGYEEVCGFVGTWMSLWLLGRT